MKFSLVTTCRNEVESFPIWKENILSQTRQPDEIVIVDAYSDDGTFELLGAWAELDPRVKIIQEKGNPATGRNTAIRNSTHKIILSTDMGVRLVSVWCEELMKPLENDHTVQVVVGNSKVDRSSVKSFSARAEWFLDGEMESIYSPNVVPGNRSIAYKKEVWDALGGLPEDLTFAADDSVFGRQIIQDGFELSKAPLAITYWQRPNKLGLFWKEQYIYGFGNGEAEIKMPFAVKQYLNGRLPKSLVPFFSALRELQKRMKFSGRKNIMETGDVATIAVLPILLFGNGWYHAKGYLDGHNRGDTECIECRNRLR